MSPKLRGVATVVASHILFAVIYLYAYFLKPLSGTEVFYWRMLGMFLTLWIMMYLSHSWHSAIIFFLRLLKQPRRLLLFLLTSPLLAMQWWLFVWGPANGHAVNVAMGYFMFPLIMVFVGFLFYGEKLSRLQWLGIAIALFGVGFELWRNQSFSWTTLLVCLGYPPFYLIRRQLAVPVLPGLFFDLCLIVPIALFGLLFYSEHASLFFQSPRHFILIILLGVSSAFAMYANIYGSFTLPVSLFGMLSYLEPIFLFLVSLLILHIRPEAAAWITYGCIWCGLLFLVIDAHRRHLESQHEAYSASVSRQHSQL